MSGRDNNNNNSTQIGLLVIASLGVALSQYACELDCGNEDCLFNNAEWQAVQKLSPLPPPELDPTNKYLENEAAINFGHKMFFEKRYSGAITILSNGSNGSLASKPDDTTGKLSCAACHLADRYFIDTRSNPGNVSVGIAYTARNSPTVINAAYYDWIGWAGLQDSLWHQAGFALEFTVGGDRCGIAHMLFTHYRAEYDAVFDEDLPADLETRFPLKCRPKANAMAPDGAWEAMNETDRHDVLQIVANTAKAIAAYEFKLVVRTTPFDRYVEGDESAISAEAKRGLQLFVGKAACNECHNTPFLTDQQFHNVALPHKGANLSTTVDQGRFADIPRMMANPFNSLGAFADAPPRLNIEGLERTEDDRGKFRTQTLRGVVDSGPYFHNGSAATLREVVEHYNDGGSTSNVPGTRDPRMVELNLSEDEISDLVEFLEALRCDPAPAEYAFDPLAAR